MESMTVELHPTDGPIQRHVSYCNYLVLPRTLLQSMSIEWQERMTACLDEMEAAFEHVPQAKNYDVRTVEEHIVWEMTDVERKVAGITVDWHGGEEPPEGLDGQDLDEWKSLHEKDSPTYYDAEGNELDPNGYAYTPIPDPIPNANRGRTYIPPFGGDPLDRSPDAMRVTFA